MQNASIKIFSTVQPGLYRPLEEAILYLLAKHGKPGAAVPQATRSQQIIVAVLVRAPYTFAQ